MTICVAGIGQLVQGAIAEDWDPSSRLSHVLPRHRLLVMTKLEARCRLMISSVRDLLTAVR